MSWYDIFEHNHKVQSYRFGDFTIEELAQLKTALMQNLESITKGMQSETHISTKKMWAEEGNTSARLYDEVSAAIRQSANDENRLKGWFE
jgi:uncharacterized protein YukE